MAAGAEALDTCAGGVLWLCAASEPERGSEQEPKAGASQ